MTDETITTETTCVNIDNSNPHVSTTGTSGQPLLGTSVSAYMVSFPVDFDYPGPTLTTTSVTIDPPLTEEGMRRVLREELAKLLADRDAQNKDERKIARKSAAAVAAKIAKKLSRKKGRH